MVRPAGEKQRGCGLWMHAAYGIIAGTAEGRTGRHDTERICHTSADAAHHAWEAFIINVCTIFDVSPEWLLFGRGVMREQSKEYPSSGCGCRQCPLVLKELDEERTERRELSVENRQLYAENRKLLQENGRLREELARLRPFSLGAG